MTRPADIRRAVSRLRPSPRLADGAFGVPCLVAYFRRRGRGTLLGVLLGMWLVLGTSCAGGQTGGDGVSPGVEPQRCADEIITLRRVHWEHDARIPLCHALVHRRVYALGTSPMLLVAWPEGRPFTSEHFASLVHELREDLMRRVQVPETRFYWKLMIGHERFYIETAFSLMLAPPEGHDGYGGERAAPADPAHVRIVYYPMIKLQLSEASYHVRSPYSDLTLEQLDERSVWTSSNEHLFVHRLHSWSLEFGREEGLLTWETDAGPVRISFGEEGPEVESAFSVEVFSMERSWENRIPAFRIQRLFRPGDDRGYLLEPVPADHRPDPWEHIIWANPRTVEHCAEALGLTAEQAFVLAEEWIECAAAYSIQTAGVLPPNITRSGEYGLPVLHHSMATEVCRDWPYCERDERGLAHFGLSGQRLVRIPGCTP